ncbi:MAG TPA: hypothetical protein VH062_16295 [Polyangiaceae bacterium]|nr:hypothetical protein [Polyangiaceae bacterium]
MKRAALLVLFGVSLVAHEHAASAAVVVVDNFTGAKKKEVRDAVADALEKGDHEVVKASAARVPPSSDEKAYVSKATEYRTAAFVDGEVKQQKSGWSVKLVVHNGADGAVLGDTTLKAAKLPKLLKKIDEEAATKLAVTIDQASAPELKKKKKEAAVDEEEKPVAEAEKPAKEEPEPEAEEPQEKHRAPPPEEHGKKPVILELAGGMQFFSRSFEYHQDVNGALHPYHLSLWPALEARVGYYPGAHVTRNMAANIGIIAGIARSFGASSNIGDAGKDYGTTMQELTVGARFRLPIQRHEIGVSFLYGNQRFDIDSDHDPLTAAANGLAVNRSYVPNASYQYLRPGLDGRLAFGKLRFGAGFGYRIIVGLGDLTAPAWFPHATAAALDGFINAGYEVLPGLSVVAGFDATRYALDMHTVAADRTAARDFAGGAVDQYLTGHLGVEYRLGESRSDAPEWRVSERRTHGGVE